VEFNPSRFVDPAGFGLAPLASVPSCIDEAISVAGEVVEFADELRLARVKRVDVTRDFTNVEHVSMLIKGFVGSHRPNARMTTLTLGTNGVAEGLATGSRSGGKVLLYDKFIESGGKVPEGTLRYEAQCRAWAQSQAGINTAMDLTEERLALLAWNRWLWSGFGSFVTGVPEVLELINRSDFSERVKRDLKGYIVLEQRGELGHLAPGTKSSYTQKLAKLGIPPSMPIDVEGSGNVRCLDLLEGTDGVFSLTEERTR